jgi:hypothetical protein
MKLDEDEEALNPFVIPYRRVAAGWALVGAGHVALWLVSMVTGFAIWKGVGLFQFAYVLPLYKRSTQWVGKGVKECAVVTAFLWVTYVLVVFLSSFGGYC